MVKIHRTQHTGARAGEHVTRAKGSGPSTPGANPIDMRPLVEIRGVGRHGQRKPPSATTAPLNPNARRMLDALGRKWELTAPIAARAGLAGAGASAGLRELAARGLAETRKVSASKSARSEWRRA
jgi:hypothetical protein